MKNDVHAAHSLQNKTITPKRKKTGEQRWPWNL